MTGGWLVTVLASAPAAEAPPAGALEFTGCCDASAAVALDERHFLIGNDEDSVLRLYDARQPGPPRQTFDFAPFLELEAKSPETDLEAAVRVGDRVYWIGSHGANAAGRGRASRQRFFATRVGRSASGFQVELEGRPYRSLLADFQADARLSGFHLGAAAERPPKDPGGLAIEGLCDTADGTLLIGFRNPVPDRQTLIVPMRNPDQVIRGERALLGDPIRFDLGGLGVRDLLRSGGDYWILAGPFGSKGGFRLFRWRGPGTRPEETDWRALKSWNPEGLAAFPATGPQRWLLVSDDGSREIDGCECKRLEPPGQRRFRALEMVPPRPGG